MTDGKNAALITHHGTPAVKARFHEAQLPSIVRSLLAAWPGAALGQQSVEDFYRGKKIDLIIGYSSGGTYDLYARLVARHLGNHIPGKPLIVPRNMPGAGSRTAATWVYNIAPRDGTVLATADQSLSLQQAAGDKRIKFDTTKFIYIGNPAEREQHHGGVARLGHQDHRGRQAPRGHRGRDRRLDLVAISQGDERAARHPVQDHPRLSRRQRHQPGDGARRGRRCAARTPGSRGRRRGAHWLAENKINILVQIGLKKAPDLPDVPLLMELGANAEDRTLLRLLSASTHIGRPIFTTPDVPAERVEALRKAFDAMVRDPAFLEQAKQENFDIDAVSGEALQKLIAEIVAMPKAQGERLKKIIE